MSKFEKTFAGGNTLKADELNQMVAAINDTDDQIASLREDTDTKLNELEKNVGNSYYESIDTSSGQIITKELGFGISKGETIYINFDKDVNEGFGIYSGNIRLWIGYGKGEFTYTADKNYSDLYLKIQSSYEIGVVNVSIMSGLHKSKANKLQSYMVGNLVSINENGDINDSGKSVSDFEPKDATILKSSNVIDSLENESTKLPLSAKQGTILNNRVKVVERKINFTDKDSVNSYVKELFIDNPNGLDLFLYINTIMNRWFIFDGQPCVDSENYAIPEHLYAVGTNNEGLVTFEERNGSKVSGSAIVDNIRYQYTKFDCKVLSIAFNPYYSPSLFSMSNISQSLLPIQNYLKRFDSLKDYEVFKGWLNVSNIVTRDDCEYIIIDIKDTSEFVIRTSIETWMYITETKPNWQGNIVFAGGATSRFSIDSMDRKFVLSNYTNANYVILQVLKFGAVVELERCTLDGKNLIENYIDINKSMLAEEDSHLYLGKKFYSLGDSIAEQERWQPVLAKIARLDYQSSATRSTEYPLGVGGSSICPKIAITTSNQGDEYKCLKSDGTQIKDANGNNLWFVVGHRPTESIYNRSKYFASQYNDAEVIVINAGQNDDPRGRDTDTCDSLGLTTDAPYEGLEYVDTKYAEVAKYYPNVAIYDDGTLGSEYKTGEYTIINARPTLCSCICAIIKNIATSCPTARIVGNSIMRPNNTLENIDPVVVSKMNAIINTYMQYGVPVADMWNEMSVNTYNFTHYYIDGVHPNALGGERMAAIISHKL